VLTDCDLPPDIFGMVDCRDGSAKSLLCRRERAREELIATEKTRALAFVKAKTPATTEKFRDA